MDLDIDQVFMYILHRPLFSVVDHITSLYQIAARTADTRVKEVLIAVAKEFMDIMILFELEHWLDFRIFQTRRLFKVISFAQIASKSLALRLACAYASACCSDSAWVLTRLVDKINNEGTKNVLRILIDDFNRISIVFQSVCEMIFRDHRPIDSEHFRRHFRQLILLEHIRPWIPHIPPFPVPRNFTELVFSGVVTESMVHLIVSAVFNLRDAVEETFHLLMFMEQGVDLDRLSNVLTHMVIVNSLLEHHFPIRIRRSIPEEEDGLLLHRRQELKWMLSQVLDIAIMALVEIESLTVSIKNNSQEFQEQFEHVRRFVYSCTSLLDHALFADPPSDSH